MSVSLRTASECLSTLIERGLDRYNDYEAADGVGFLVCGLPQLHEMLAQPETARTHWNL